MPLLKMGSATRPGAAIGLPPMASAANLEPNAESLNTRAGRRADDQCGRDARAPRNDLNSWLSGTRAPHEFMLQPQNKECFERLRTRSPVAAVQAWLEGDFGMGDEPALIAAIRENFNAASQPEIVPGGGR